MREPSADALAADRNVQRRLRGRTSAPVRRQFIKRSTDGRAAPLATALRGGRGGTVRVKLELTFLWFAANPPRSRLSGAGLGDAARPARSRRARRPPHQRGDPVAGTALSRERQWGWSPTGGSQARSRDYRDQQTAGHELTNPSTVAQPYRWRAGCRGR